MPEAQFGQSLNKQHEHFENNMGANGKSRRRRCQWICREFPGHLFVATEAGIFKSTDRLVTWEKLSQNAGPYEITAIAINASDILFCGDSEGSVYRSQDQGESWTLIKDVNFPINAIKSDSNNTLYFGSIDGLFVSRNQGDNWTSVDLEGESVYSIGISGQDVVYAGTSSGVFLSKDHGTSWELAGLEGMEHILALEIDTDGILYAGMRDGVVYRSSDEGGNWQTRDNGIPYWASVSSLVCAGNGDIYAASEYAGIFQSSNQGVSWEQVSTYSYNTAMALYQDEFILAGSMFNGVIVSQDNGATWTIQPIGLRAMTIHSIAFDSENHIYVCGEQSGIYRYDGTVWSTFGLANDIVSKIVTNFNDEVIALTKFEGLKSSPDGMTWEQLNTSWVGFYGTSLDINDNGILFCSNGGNLYESKDKSGNSWKLIGTGYGARSVTFGSDLKIYTANDAGFFSALDSGEEWKQLDDKAYTQSMYALAVNEHQEVFWGTSESGVYRYTENSDSLELLGLEGYHITSLIVTDQNHIFASAAGDGVFYSDDDGATWLLANQGLSRHNINLLVEGPDGKIYAGTVGDGIYSCDDAD